SLAAFAWLLTLHPTAAGRTYAAYGGMYIAVALVWLRVVNGIARTRWDIAGAGVALAGMAIIARQPAAPSKPGQPARLGPFRFDGLAPDLASRRA
ncbi:MAG TPA: YnfA family protein, partial [Thauera sp.]|nr:YnfA family protein [Thauera sp.]